MVKRGMQYVGLGVMLAACGPTEEQFLIDYTNLVCAHTIQCGDPAELTFDGILSVETCKGYKISEIQAWGDGCKFTAPAAKQCVEELGLLTCSTDGLGTIPSVCGSVYAGCDLEPISGGLPTDAQPIDTAADAQ